MNVGSMQINRRMQQAINVKTEDNSEEEDD